MPNLIPFVYQGQDIPVQIDSDDNPLWRAADVGKILAYKGDMGQHIRRIDEDERVLIINQGGVPEWWVTESGLYNLILRSRKPETKAFRRWVTHEVIPQIRKTGRYEHQFSRVLTTAEMFLQQAHINIELEQRQARIEAEVCSVKAEVAQLKAARPPQDKLTLVDWLRRTGKPRLSQQHWDSFKAHARRLEQPEPWTSPARTYPDYFYTPHTIEKAYGFAMRQLILFSKPHEGA